MAKAHGAIVIERPIADVFDFVADQRNEILYNKRMTPSVKLTDGPIGIGIRFRATVTSRGRPIDMVIEFTDYQRPTLLMSTTTTMPSMNISGTLRFLAVGASTCMACDWSFHPSGSLRLWSPLFSLQGKRPERAIWTSLKLEATP